jgi:hypothetical protein
MIGVENSRGETKASSCCRLDILPKYYYKFKHPAASNNCLRSGLELASRFHANIVTSCEIIKIEFKLNLNERLSERHVFF